MAKKLIRHHNSSVAMNDLLFNVLVGFVFLFIMAFILINPPTKKADIPAKAEFIIMLEWNKNSADDIDLWVQYEDEPPVGFRNLQGGGLYLERDDLGYKNDKVTVNGETQIIRLNNETVIIRGVIPGNYYVGIHGYRIKEVNRALVSVIDVNPYKEVYRKEVTIDTMNQKVAMPAFTIDNEGNIIETFEHSRPLGPSETSHRASSPSGLGVL